MAIAAFLAAFSRQRAARADNAGRGRRAANRFAGLVDTPPAQVQDLIEESSGPPPCETLSVESGLHRGAVLELRNDEYLIGAGADCDIVLGDEGVAEHQWRLVREPAGYSVWANDAAASQRVQPHTVIDAPGATETVFDLGGVRLKLMRHGGVAPSQPMPLPVKRSRLRGRHLVHALLLGAVITAFGLTAAPWPGTQAIPDIAHRIVSASKALEGQGFDDIRFRRGGRGEFEVSGLVADPEEQARLQSWLLRSGYGDAQSTVRQANSLVEQVRQVLAGEPLKISNDGTRVRIEGTTSKLAIKNRVSLLAEELKGVVDIDDRVIYTDARAAREPGPLPVRVRDVMIGTPSYFRTDNGAVYFEGALMPDGAEVIAIEAAQIRFRLGEKILVFSLE